MNALLIGLRLAVTGGRSARLRAVLTAGGVALGMIVLLVAASVPSAINAIDNRQAARSALQGGSGKAKLLVADAYTRFRDDDIRGQRMQPLVADPPAPPGLRELPEPGTMAVSPALRDLLNAEPLLRERLDQEIVETIGPEGLTGPRELVFYAGAEGLDRTVAYPSTGFGYEEPSEPMPGFLVLIVAVGVVVLLLPGRCLHRDRRALRLGGARPPPGGSAARRRRPRDGRAHRRRRGDGGRRGGHAARFRALLRPATARRARALPGPQHLRDGPAPRNGPPDPRRHRRSAGDARGVDLRAAACRGRAARRDPAG